MSNHQQPQAQPAKKPPLGKLRAEVVRYLKEPSPSPDKKKISNAPKKAASTAWDDQMAQFQICNAGGCRGDLHIGVFFDGTGNNKDEDYGKEGKPKDFLERKHTNVVRLYNAFPDEEQKWRRENKPEDDLNQYYRIYVPGVGTPFKEIGDDGGGLGSTAGAGGEARILWAMIQVLNAVHKFRHGRETNAFSDSQANQAIQAMLHQEKKEKEEKKPSSHPGFVRAVKTWMYTDKELRVQTFQNLIKQLRLPDIKPELGDIYLYPFGFSRGAAEARAFCTWMVEILGGKEAYPLQLTGFDGKRAFNVLIPFLGLFDTVCSVGMASMYSFSEGRMGWAHNTMEIPSQVGECVHMVAAHEIRACFPLDSVREDAFYPDNCEEIVYPGAHSDVGGGYAFNRIGKADVDLSFGKEFGKHASGDMQISRVPGFDMYLRALTPNKQRVKVPFYTIEQLRAQERAEIAKDLLPDLRTIDAMQRYLDVTQHEVPGELPVEDQIKRHTALYLHWRWRQGTSLTLEPVYDQATEQGRLERIIEHKDAASKEATKEASMDRLKLKFTQWELMFVIAAYCREIAERISDMDGDKSQWGAKHTQSSYWKPLANPLTPEQKISKQIDDGLRDMVAVSLLSGGSALVLGAYQGAKKAYGIYEFIQKVEEWVKRFNGEELRENWEVAKGAVTTAQMWRAALARAGMPELHDEPAPEREAMWLLDGLAAGEKFYAAKKEAKDILDAFFFDCVHDSMAGFIVPEFLVNGYGIGKFRSVNFGRYGPNYTCVQVVLRNNKRWKAAEDSPQQNTSRVAAAQNPPPEKAAQSGYGWQHQEELKRLFPPKKGAR